MEVIRRVVEDELHLTIPIAGLAKDGRHRTRELLYGHPPLTVGMKPESELFRLMTRMQDEVHRFAITFHRDKRSKRQTQSELDAIAGIGPKTKELLLKKLGSVKKIKEAEFEALAALVGSSKARTLISHFHPTPSTPQDL